MIFTGIIAIGFLFSPIKDSALWWIISIICTPLYTIILGLTIELTLFTFMLSFVIILKRLLSNKEETKTKTSINLILLRLFFDRDIYDRKKSKISILMKNNSISDLSSISDQHKFNSLNNKTEKYFLCYTD